MKLPCLLIEVQSISPCQLRAFGAPWFHQTVSCCGRHSDPMTSFDYQSMKTIQWAGEIIKKSDQRSKLNDQVVRETVEQEPCLYEPK